MDRTGVEKTAGGAGGDPESSDPADKSSIQQVEYP